MKLLTFSGYRIIPSVRYPTCWTIQRWVKKTWDSISLNISDRRDAEQILNDLINGVITPKQARHQSFLENDYDHE